MPTNIKCNPCDKRRNNIQGIPQDDGNELVVFHLINKHFQENNTIVTYDIEVEIPFLGTVVYRKYYVTVINGQYYIDSSLGRVAKISDSLIKEDVPMDVKRAFSKAGYVWRF